jgi:hypothetical protein
MNDGLVRGSGRDTEHPVQRPLKAVGTFALFSHDGEESSRKSTLSLSRKRWPAIHIPGEHEVD